MSQLSHDLLMLEFLSWISSRPRTYTEAMNAWQSSCPRHTIWEDAMIEGYIQIHRNETIKDPEITLTPIGFALLQDKNGRV
jgi:hypothetical protein